MRLMRGFALLMIGSSNGRGAIRPSFVPSFSHGAYFTSVVIADLTAKPLPVFSDSVLALQLSRKIPLRLAGGSPGADARYSCPPRNL